MNIYNFSQYDSGGMKYPEFESKLIAYKDYKYYLPSSKDVDIFNEIKYMYNNSSLHSSILNNLIQQVYGTGLIPQTTDDEDIIEKYNLNLILMKCVFDFCLFGGAYIEIFWNLDHTKILRIKHIKYEQIRIGDYDEVINDDILIYYHCPNWKDWRKSKITPLVKFNTNPVSDNHQVMPIYYQQFLDVYPKPYYFQLWRWVAIDTELSKFFLNLIKNNFVANTMIVLPGIMEPEQKEDLEYILKKNFTGSEGLKTIIFNPETPENKPEIIKFNSDDDGQKYSDWISMVSQQIVSGHQLPSTSLAGISEAGKLGSTQELATAQLLYNHKKVYPFRNYFIDAFTLINKYFIDPLSDIQIEDIQLEFIEKPLDTGVNTPEQPVL